MDSETFVNVPVSYSVATTRALQDITDPNNYKQLALGADNLHIEPLDKDGNPATIEEFETALRERKSAPGLFSVRIGGVEFLSQSLFRASLPLAPNVPVGTHKARAFLFRNGLFIKESSAQLAIVKSGFEQSHRPRRGRPQLPLRHLRGGAGDADRLARPAHLPQGLRASAGLKQAAGDGENAARADHVGHQALAPEQPGIGAVEHVERSGIGAEGRHDGARAVGGEAAPAHRAAALHDAGAGMQMAGDLALEAQPPTARAGTSGRRSPAHRRFRPAGRQAALRVVIAGNPEPVAAGRQRRQAGARCSPAGAPRRRRSWKLSPRLTTILGR